MSISRQQDRRNLEAYTAALRGDVYGALGELTVEDIAARLSFGADSIDRISPETLRGCLEGRRKFPAHKLAILAALTGRNAVLHELARQQNCLCVPRPTGDPINSTDASPVVRAFGEMLREFGEGTDANGPGGNHFTAEEAAEFSATADEVIRLALELKYAVEAQVRPAEYTSLAAAEAADKAIRARV